MFSLTVHSNLKVGENKVLQLPALEVVLAWKEVDSLCRLKNRGANVVLANLITLKSRPIKGYEEFGACFKSFGLLMEPYCRSGFRSTKTGPKPV